MFLIVLIFVLVGATAQLLRSGPRTAERAGRLLLLWVLIGYCGVPMLLVSAATLARPHLVADVLGLPADNPFQTFLGWAYLGMSLIATLAVRFRGRYLIGPSIVWSVFFTGATATHLQEGTLTHGGVAGLFATHGLISILLVGGLLMSGVLLSGEQSRP